MKPHDGNACFISLRKKFFRSQAQRAGNRHILKARKKLHRPELFLPKHGRFGNFDMINLPETSSTVAPIYLPLFTFKERNSGLFCPIFLKFTFDNFSSPVGLVILKFYLPGPNFTSLGHRACTIFLRLQCVGHLVTNSSTFCSKYARDYRNSLSNIVSYYVTCIQNVQYVQCFEIMNSCKLLYL